MKITPKTASEFLKYNNEKVVRRFMRDEAVDHETADQIFRETLKFFYLCTVLEGPCSPPSLRIDQMWHTFLLHTPDYAAFCFVYAGRFLHHDPTEVPYIGNRSEMLKQALDAFGTVDHELWHHV